MRSEHLAIAGLSQAARDPLCTDCQYSVCLSIGYKDSPARAGTPLNRIEPYRLGYAASKKVEGIRARLQYL